MRTSKKAGSGAHPGRGGAGRGAGGSRSAGSRIVSAIEDATELLRREGMESERITVRTYRLPPAPREYRPDDVKRVRELLGTSQAVLAGFLGVNVNTVRSWEQGKRPPQPIARRFLAEIESDPGYWRRRIGEQTAAPRVDEPKG
jgi:DNA-binding transcriptional regulator YiaG